MTVQQLENKYMSAYGRYITASLTLSRATNDYEKWEASNGKLMLYSQSDYQSLKASVKQIRGKYKKAERAYYKQLEQEGV